MASLVHHRFFFIYFSYLFPSSILFYHIMVILPYNDYFTLSKIWLYVSTFSRELPHKIVLQPHYMRKMEPTFPIDVRLSVYPPIPPFLIPTYGTIGDFLRALLKAFPSAVLFGASMGLTLLNSQLPAHHFADLQGPLPWLSSLPFPAPAFFFHPVEIPSGASLARLISTLPVAPVPCAWRGIFACPNF